MRREFFILWLSMLSVISCGLCEVPRPAIFDGFGKSIFCIESYLFWALTPVQGNEEKVEWGQYRCSNCHNTNDINEWMNHWSWSAQAIMRDQSRKGIWPYKQPPHVFGLKRWEVWDGGNNIYY